MNSDYLVGKIIDNRYEILEMIGSGGMATVYKAKCRVLNRNVAIKVLKDSLKSDMDVIRRFNTESRAAARLSHPNIVQVYDVGESDGLDYIVMELVDGITLSEYIKNKGRLLWEEACNYAIQIASAIACAHENHVIHRDIKPHNVIMSKDGTLKVADFGIAQAATSDTLVAGKSSMGSVHYISPEQARGGYTDERSDLYSLGVVLFEMLTGELPFVGENPVSVALMKLEQEPRDCRELNQYIPDSVAKITMKAISKEQHSRYQSALAMIDDLETLMGRGYNRKKNDGTGYDTRRIHIGEVGKMSRRKKKQPTMYILFAILGVLVISIGTYAFMSSGTKEFIVPDLTGYTIGEAEEILKAANLLLDPDIEYEENAEIEEGLIISHKPGAEQYVKKNRKITIVVSQGAGDTELTVIDVENLTKDEAKIKLEKAGFVCKIEEEFSETVQFDYVIRQSPNPKEKAKKGSTVTIYVSSDIEDPDENMTTVPKLTGYDENQAKALLEHVELDVGEVTIEENPEVAGTIITQDPVANTKVEKGTKVNFVVSAGMATPTPTPDMKKKMLTITIPDDANDVVNVKVIANGKQIYSSTHNKSEQTVDIPVQSSKDAKVQVYIDEKLVVDKVITF